MSQEIEAKKAALETLRQGFMGLMNIVMQTKSSNMQKQQALLKFDEGHMWLQNGIMSYQEPAQPTTIAPAVQDTPETEHHAIAPNGEDHQQEQTAVA